MAGRVSITFDDGLSSVYLLALSEMERYDMTGTVFVISDLIGRTYRGYPTMNERMLRSLSSKGWEIGSHTQTHSNLTELSDLQVNAELRDSKKHLENITSTKILGLAYPSDRYDNRIKAIAAKYYSFARNNLCYPPLRTNSLHPRDQMELRAMGGSEHALALPLHLFDSHISRIIGYRPGLGKPRNLNRERGWINPPTRGLEGRFIRKWVRNLSKNRWLILNIHDISADKPLTPYSISLREFCGIVKAINQHAELVNLGEEHTT